MSTGPKGRSALIGNKFNYKHGIYSKAIRPEEEELYDEIGVGSVDEELKLCRLRLARAVVREVELEDAEKAVAGKAKAGDEAPLKSDPAGLATTKSEINAILARIDRLENRRAQLKEMGAGVDDPDDVARDIKAALDEIQGMTAVPAPAKTKTDADA